MALRVLGEGAEESKQPMLEKNADAGKGQELHGYVGGQHVA